MPRQKTNIDIFGFDNDQVALSQQLDSGFQTEYYFSCNISKTMDPKRGVLVIFCCLFSFCYFFVLSACDCSK